MLALLGQQRALGTYYRDEAKGEVIPQKRLTERERKALNACILISGSPGAGLFLYTWNTPGLLKSHSSETTE